MNIKTSLKSVLAVFALAVVSAGAQAASGVGPYYAMPAWDQTLPASTRFIDLTNMPGAVLDRETGLVWEKVPSTSTRDWLAASFHCLNSNTGGRKGWRLPALQELASLMDPTQSNPALPSGHPFTVQSSDYWSATSAAFNPTLAWGVGFVSGLVDADSKSGGGNLAWCVRGGPGGDTQ